jgi:glycosyltransferase involved in cell wall biosynthesis
MKLLYITNGINSSGGLERVLSIKASCLAEDYGYEVTILSLNDNHINPFYTFSDKINHVSISVKGNAFQYVKSYIFGLKEIIKLINPDVISVCDDGLKGFFIPKLLFKNTPIIYERHVSKEVELQQDYSFLKKKIVRSKWALMEYLAKDFDCFIVLTKGNIQEWSKLRNILIIPNPLSFYPDVSSSLQNKKVIAVGRQAYQKGYDLLLQTWQIVHDKCPDWELEIYGKKDLSFNFEELACNLRLEKNIYFLDPEKNIIKKYLDSSIYVMSSRYEGFGMVLIEAMACGVPCVSFDCNYGPSDIIHNNLDGFIVEKENTQALAEKLILLIENENLRLKMGKEAKKSVQRYMPKEIVAEWDILFKKLNK